MNDDTMNDEGLDETTPAAAPTTPDLTEEGDESDTGSGDESE